MNATEPIIINRRIREKRRPKGEKRQKHSDQYPIVLLAELSKAAVYERRQEHQNNKITNKPPVSLDKWDQCGNKLLEA